MLNRRLQSYPFPIYNYMHVLSIVCLSRWPKHSTTKTGPIFISALRRGWKRFNQQSSENFEEMLSPFLNKGAQIFRHNTTNVSVQNNHIFYRLKKCALLVCLWPVIIRMFRVSILESEPQLFIAIANYTTREATRTRNYIALPTVFHNLLV